MKPAKGQLTKRDINLIEYCRTHLPVNSDIAAALFYPNKYIAQRRLTTIHNLKQLKRTERLVVNQPYIYYHEKKDLKYYPLSLLLHDIRAKQFEIEDITFKDEQLTAIIHKEQQSFRINANLQNISQVYKRLAL